VAAIDFLRTLPVFSAIVWYSLAILQVYRDRFRTWTERFFLLACFFTGLYAESDLAFFSTSNPAVALTLAKLSVTAITFAAVFFFMFTQTYLGKMKQNYVPLLVPPAALVPVIWAFMVQDVVQPEPGSLFIGVFNPYIFGAWLVIMVAYSSKGLFNVYRLQKIVKEQSERLSKRIFGIFIALVSTFFLGLLTNGYLGVTQNTAFPPPFSSLFVIPGLLVSATLYPGARGMVSEAIRRFRARRYVIQSVMLLYNNGLVMRSSSRQAEGETDRDLLGATLDVIQNFMRTSFPLLRGKSLKTIEHGDVRIIIERGRFCYIAVILEGEESDLLRRQMRDELEQFEAANRGALVAWRGDPTETVGGEQMLSRILAPPELFGA